MDYANIILEMLDRIKKLEQEVKELQQTGSVGKGIDADAAITGLVSPPLYSASSVGRRDTTRYLFEGNVYLKNRLVLAVVKTYVAQNRHISRHELKQIFPKTLQGSIGVVEDSEIAEGRSDYEVRFFTKPNEILHLSDGNMYVCTQWGILNIPNFICRAEQLGFEIETIK